MILSLVCPCLTEYLICVRGGRINTKKERQKKGAKNLKKKEKKKTNLGEIPRMSFLNYFRLYDRY